MGSASPSGVPLRAWRPWRALLAAPCRLCREALARGEQGQLDMSAVEDVSRNTRLDGQMVIAFYVGRSLKRHGKPEDAKACVRRCAESADSTYRLRPIAAEMLRTWDDKDGAKSKPGPASGRPKD